MGWYTDQVVPRFINVALGSKRFVPMRQRVTAGLEGDVVEIGFGSGLNVPYYPSTVRSVKAIDPSAVGQTLAPIGSPRPQSRSSTWGSMVPTCRLPMAQRIMCCPRGRSARSPTSTARSRR